MQLFALDAYKQLIPAQKAQKHYNYICLECQGVVRLRSGIHRQAHFFHLKPAAGCHLSAKSMAHIQTQCYLQKTLPPGECLLEVRFPSIGRIADAVWTAKKLIFEVQCSPISSEEVHTRISDYATLGYQVIWILHDKLYNQTRLSAAELYLRNSPYYFTNMDKEGHGFIYDQFDLWIKGWRRYKMAPLTIDIANPQTITPFEHTEIPTLYRERVRSWSLHFGDDFIDQGKMDSSYFSHAYQMELEYAPPPTPTTLWKGIQDLFHKICVRPYALFFQLFLERNCK